MRIETLEQIAAVVVTAGLVTGNFLMFTPWRDGHDPRERPRGANAGLVRSGAEVAVSAKNPMTRGEQEGQKELEGLGQNDAACR